MLVPNLALLNANNWADKVVDLPISRLMQTSLSLSLPPTQNQLLPRQPPNVRLPLSFLRFQFSYNGALLDKALTSFVDTCFEHELLKRARSKGLQGLIYRLIEHCVIAPGTFGRLTSFRKLVTGKSVTHTCTTHLSEAYRKGTLLYMRNVSKADSSTFLTSITKDILNIHKHRVLKQCPWCTLYTGEYTPPTSPVAGNLHHFFFLLQQHQHLTLSS